MNQFLTAAAPFVIIVLLVVLVFGVFSAYGELIHLRQLLIQQYELAKHLAQNESDRSAHAEATAKALEQIAELQSITLARVHKIAIHYAPYLRSKRDVKDEIEHRENILFDYDIDSRVAQERSAQQGYELNPRDPIEGNMVPEVKRS